MRIAGYAILNRAKRLPVTKIPEYHYVGDVKSYEDMLTLLKENFNLIFTKYTPIGIHRSMNINAVHVFRKTTR